MHAKDVASFACHFEAYGLERWILGELKVCREYFAKSPWQLWHSPIAVQTSRIVEHAPFAGAAIVTSAGSAACNRCSHAARSAFSKLEAALHVSLGRVCITSLTLLPSPAFCASISAVCYQRKNKYTLAALETLVVTFFPGVRSFWTVVPSVLLS